MKKLALIGMLGVAVATAFFLYFQESAYEWSLPPDLPPPAVPDDNPMTAAKIELGRWLFYDTRLSGNKTMSCASCHIQALAFTDGKRRSIGSTGEIHPRSSMSLVNVAYASRLTWANPLLDRLEDQALTPLLGDNPVEMGFGDHAEELAALLETEANYRALTAAAFPAPVSYESIVGPPLSSFTETRLEVSSRL